MYMPTKNKFMITLKPFMTRKKILGIAVVSTIVAFIVLSSLNCQVPEDASVFSTTIADVQLLQYSISTDACTNDTYMLVLCGSNPEHGEVRDVIRQTWGNPKIPNFPFRLIFLFGQPVSPVVQQHLEEESAKYGDILQGDFIDSYHNITPRDLMGLKWAWENW